LFKNIGYKIKDYGIPVLAAGSGKTHPSWRITNEIPLL
jgi:hypothetical protein